MNRYINIVSFNIPYPANYGGVIDVFYRLKALHKEGMKIILHAFEYGREHTSELNKYCEKVIYYKRKTGILSQLTTLPYIVYSRKNEELLNNLLKNDYPILFEGIHSCYYLNDSRLSNRTKMVRAHNIEHEYYQGLARKAKSYHLKFYLNMEAVRLRKFEKKLRFADHILAISTVEELYFKENYGKEKTVFIPLFHPNNQLQISDNCKPYVLYHGDLSTPENINSALFLIEKAAKKDKKIAWVIAGLNPDKSIYQAAQGMDNVSIKANLPHDELQTLIQEAAVNVLYTGQVSGVKLKLINALHNGHHCIANKKMTTGSGLDSLCIPMPDDSSLLLESIRHCLNNGITEEEKKKRETILTQLYNNKENAKKIIGLIP